MSAFRKATHVVLLLLVTSATAWALPADCHYTLDDGCQLSYFTALEYGEVRTKWAYSCGGETQIGYAPGSVDQYCPQST